MLDFLRHVGYPNPPPLPQTSWDEDIDLPDDIQEYHVDTQDDSASRKGFDGWPFLTLQIPDHVAKAYELARGASRIMKALKST